MSKKINFRTIKAEALTTLSSFNGAYQNICAIKKHYKALLDAAEAARADIIVKRGEALQLGKTEAEVVAEFPLTEADKRIRQLEEERDAALKPHNETIRTSVATLPDDLFGAYAYAMDKGIGAAVPKKGTYVTVGNKSYWVSQNFAENIKDVVVKWGLGHSDDEKAVAKFADIIKGRIAGMQKDSKGGYLKLKGQRTLGELFLLATIQYFLNEGVIAMGEDYALTIA